MARQIGDGGDNVMGSKEAIVNVSFKDDLGNILENATKLKEILDAVNSNFLAINSAVGITTSSMGKLSSQTQRLVATTQQLRNEYQIIADATQRIGVSQTVQSPAGLFQDTDVVRQAISGGGQGVLLGNQENMAIGSTAGLEKLIAPERPRIGRTQIYNALDSDHVRSRNLTPSEQRDARNIIRAFESGTSPDKLKSMPNFEKVYGSLPTSIRETIPRASVYSTPFLKKGFSEMMRDYQAGGSAMSIATKALGTIAGPEIAASIATAVPYITAIAGAATAVYKATDYLIKGSTRYSGLTGGTGVMSNTGAASGSQTFIGLQARRWFDGFMNMAVGVGGYQQIQEALLGAGYTARDDDQYAQKGIRGMRYEVARSTLAELYGKGLQDVDQNLQLMQLVAERGGGSLTTLMGTIDNLRTVSLKTNASLKVMTQTMTTAISGLIGGMNVMGGSAAFIGGNNATAYANSANSLLRGSGAPDYNNFLTQMMMIQSPSFQAAGVTANNMFGMMANPLAFPGGQGLAFAKASDYAVDRFVGNFGIRKGTDLETAKRIIGENYSTRVRALQSSPGIQALVGDPKIYQNTDAFIEFLARNAIGEPQTEAAEKAQRQNLARDIRTGQDSRTGYSVATGGQVKLDPLRIGKEADVNRYFERNFGGRKGVDYDAGIFNPLATGAAMLVGGIMGAGAGAAATVGSAGAGLPLIIAGAAAGAGLGSKFSDLEGLSGAERDANPQLAAYYDYVKATGKGVGWINTVMNRGENASANTYVRLGANGKPMTMQDLLLGAAAGNKNYQMALEGKGSTRLQVATREKGQSIEDLKGWMDSSEFGGGGGLAANKPLNEMNTEDFAEAVKTGLMRFNARDTKGLRVYNYND